MDITLINQVHVIVENTVDKNEVAAFIGIVKKCITKQSGLKKTFSDDEKELLNKIAKGLGIEQEETLYE